jgi:hypothetical protein
MRENLERFELLPYPTTGSGAGTWASVAGLETVRAQAKSSSPSLTVTWQGSIDGTSAGSILAIPVSGTAAATAANPADGALFDIDVTGLTHVRANVTAYTSGSVGINATGIG